MTFQQNCPVIENQEVAPRHFKITLTSPDISLKAKPGQFVNAGCNQLLRRPLSIHKVDRIKKTFELLYQVAGKGTRYLSDLKAGQEVDILGPLGNGFTVPVNKESAILIGGGMGIAPLLFLAEELAKQNKKICVLLGNKTKDLIIGEKDFKNLGAEVFITTEDGSWGEKGLVTDLLLEEAVMSYASAVISIYACGPKEMLKLVSGIALAKNIKTEVCLEEMMGCGLGGCYSCVAKTESGYQRVCTEGPVFDSNKIVWC